MEQIKSTGLVLSEKNNLVQIPIGFYFQKLKQSNILAMGDFNFDLQNKNFRFSEFMEHTFSSK
jgi:hypothetical protein